MGMIGAGIKPGIGICPIVDGRKGLREAHTRAIVPMVKAVCDFLGTIHDCDGEAFRCVISEPVGSGVDAVRRDELFRRERVGAVIYLARAWSYPMEVLLLDSALPQAIWGCSGTNAPGTVFMAALSAAATQNGVPLFKIYGHDIQDADDYTIPEDVQEQLARFLKAAMAVAYLKGRGYLQIGGVCMGIGSARVNEAFFQRYLGMRVAQVDSAELLRRIRQGIYDPEELQAALKWFETRFREGEDPNPPEKRETPEEKHKHLQHCVLMTLVMRDLMDGNANLAKLGYPEEAAGKDALAASFQGQREWADWLPSGSVAESVLSSGFDWTGPRRVHPVATESDSLQAAAMLMGFLLTGCAQYFCDVRAYWSPEALERRYGKTPEAEQGFIYLTNSGAFALDGAGSVMPKPYWKMTEADIAQCMEKCRWHADKRAVFQGGGFSVSYRMGGSIAMTMLRIHDAAGVGPVMQVVEGHTITLPAQMADDIASRTDKTWPQVFFVPEKVNWQAVDLDAYDVVSSWGSNHCVLCPGHVGDLLITFAAMLRIPVSLHNIHKRRIQRPDFWNALGCAQDYGTDYRACEALGPLY